MNTGQRLVQLSGLPSCSALAHLVAITQTGGSGGLVFSHAGAVAILQADKRVVSEQDRATISDMVQAASVFVSGKNAYVSSAVERLAVTSHRGGVNVLTASEHEVVAQQLETFTIRRK
jgi:hypothetical protein